MFEILGNQKIIRKHGGHSCLPSYGSWTYFFNDDPVSMRETLQKNSDEAKKEMESFNDPFFRICDEWFVESEKPGHLSQVDFFNSKLGTGFHNSSSFQKFYGSKLSRYRRFMATYSKRIWSEEEILEFIRLLPIKKKEYEDQQLEKAEKERITIESLKTRREDEIKEFLTQFKDGKQFCISLLNDKTHHLVDKSTEINMLFRFGYELLNDLTKGAVVFLKPGENYCYSEKFENALKEFYFPKCESGYYRVDFSNPW